MRPLPVPTVRELKPVIHGGLNYGDLAIRGISPNSIIDFSVSINPLPPHPEVIEASVSSDLGIYPDRFCGVLRSRLAELNGVSQSNVLVTNGASQAIWLVAMAYLRQGRSSSVVAPAYGEYVAPSAALGAKVSLWDCSRTMLWGEPDMDLLLRDRIVSDPPTVLWLCSPNNPTGYAMKREQIEVLLDLCTEGPTMLVIDEAYRNFMEKPPYLESLICSKRLLLIRSMTKDYGMPGIRLGYVIGSEEAISAMALVQPDWSVGAQAQNTGMAFLNHLPYYREQWRLLGEEKKRLSVALAGLGLTVVSGEANFLLCHHPNYDKLMAFLKRMNILVRDCRSFGLDGFFRIGVKGRSFDDILLAAIEAFLRDGVR